MFDHASGIGVSLRGKMSFYSLNSLMSLGKGHNNAPSGNRFLLLFFAGSRLRTTFPCLSIAPSPARGR